MRSELSSLKSDLQARSVAAASSGRTPGPNRDVVKESYWRHSFQRVVGFPIAFSPLPPPGVSIYVAESAARGATDIAKFLFPSPTRCAGMYSCVASALPRALVVATTTLALLALASAALKALRAFSRSEAGKRLQTVIGRNRVELEARRWFAKRKTKSFSRHDGCSATLPLQYSSR